MEEKVVTPLNLRRREPLDGRMAPYTTDIEPRWLLYWWSLVVIFRRLHSTHVHITTSYLTRSGNDTLQGKNPISFSMCVINSLYHNNMTISNRKKKRKKALDTTKHTTTLLVKIVYSTTWFQIVPHTLIGIINQWLERFLGIITGWDPCVYKSNRLHVHVIRFSFIKLGYIL